MTVNQHGKSTEITVDALPITAWSNTSELTRAGDTHDTTPYGVDDHVVDPGLGKGEFTAGGFYDKTATTGTKAVLGPRVKTKCAMIRKCEGTGTGKPQESFLAVLEEYKEANSSTDYVKWTAKWTISGPITDTIQ